MGFEQSDRPIEYDAVGYVSIEGPVPEVEISADEAVAPLTATTAEAFPDIVAPPDADNNGY